MGQLSLLRRMSAGDIVIPEVAVNRVLRHAKLDEGLPMHWETLVARFYDGYFELDIQGALGPLHGPVFRLQARFESVDISVQRQVIRIRLLREIQTFAHGVVERALLIFFRAVFGRLLDPESLLKMADRGNSAFVQESPDILRMELHEMEPIRRQLDKRVVEAIAAVLGEETVLVHAIDCRQGELIVRTTTVAQEMARKGLKLGVVAGSAAQRVFGAIGDAGRAVAEDVRKNIAASSNRAALPEPEDPPEDD
jgi:hypothetical protein